MKLLRDDETMMGIGSTMFIMQNVNISNSFSIVVNISVFSKVNKRLDEWVGADRFDFSTLRKYPTKREEGSTKKMTRSRKKSSHDVSHKEDTEKLSVLEREHQEITKVCIF